MKTVRNLGAYGTQRAAHKIPKPFYDFKLEAAHMLLNFFYMLCSEIVIFY